VLIRRQVERGALRQAGQDERRLELRKRIADALALPAVERKVREPRQALRQRPVQPALGRKLLRIGEEARVVVHQPLAHEQGGPAPDGMPTKAWRPIR